MKFTLEKDITYEQAVERMFEMLGDWKIMALASSVNDYVMVRNVSCLFYDEKIWFKTDKNFRKTKQLLENPHVALCWSGYKEHLWESYNKYSHEDTEILIEIEPKYVEIWDTSDEGYAFQLFIDFENKTVEPKIYDQK